MGLATMFACSVLPGCARERLDPTLPDAALQARFDEDFPEGTPLAEIHTRLTERGVSEKCRTFYDATPTSPPQLLARHFGAGGFWLTEEDERVTWVDAIFVLHPDRTLERVELRRGSQRYFQGEPVNIPAEPTKYRWGRYPVMPPPPAEAPVK